MNKQEEEKQNFKQNDKFPIIFILTLIVISLFVGRQLTN